MRQLDALVALVRAVLGEAALGGYLHGSTRDRDGCSPRATRTCSSSPSRPMTDDERRALVTGILPLSGRRAAGGPARPVELTVVVRDDVRPWRFPPTEDLLYGEWERAAYEAGELPRAPPEPGPRAAAHDGPRRRARGVRATAADAPRSRPAPTTSCAPSSPGSPACWPTSTTTRGTSCCTLARILVTVETGEIVAKDEAAERVLPRLGARERAVLERARDAYRGPDYGSFADLEADVRPCADALIRAIDEAVSSRPA